MFRYHVVKPYVPSKAADGHQDLGGAGEPGQAQEHEEDQDRSITNWRDGGPGGPRDMRPGSKRFSGFLLF
jgi:hypothetical protein